MAGAFTHMAIVSDASKSFPVGQKFGNLVHTYLNFLTLGSVSPDIPYLAYLALGGFSLADIMHYHQTNGIVHNALHSLGVAKKKENDWECQLAWLAGFVAHLVADATIHPIVECIAGPCTDPDSHSRHTECEMIQDVLIFKEVKNLELTSTQYSDELKACRTHASFDKVSEFWAAHAKVNCPSGGSFSPQRVFDSYFALLDTVSGPSGLAGAFRHLGFKYVYRTYIDITTTSPDLVQQYYSAIPLPNGLTGSFRKDGFDYAVRNLVAIWSKIDRALFSTENIVDIVPNWNLDTGVNQTTGVRTYWS
jgi:hypothetical protein